MHYSKLVDEDIQVLTKIVGSDRIFVGDAIAEEYAHDELGEARAMPDVVVEPDHVDQVAAIMRYAHDKTIPVTTRGSGTGLCGGCVPLKGGILLLTTGLNKILDIDQDNLQATIEPGVILLDFQERVEQLGLLYAPDPGEKSATIGGNVATNAGGMRAVKYGVTRDHITGMEVVLATGETVQLGGKVAKNSSGYSLLHLMIGSEGTLGIITKITVKLLPLPRRAITLLVPFYSLRAAIRAVPEIMRSRFIPQSLEFMERDVLIRTEKYLAKPFPHKSAPAYLLLRFDGNSTAELDEAFHRVAQICLEQGAEDVLIADTVDRQSALWDARGVFLEALKADSEMDEVDVVVPKNHIARFVEYTKELEMAYGVRMCSFGHAGDGNTHVYIMRDDLALDEWRDKKEVIMQRLYAKGNELGGQVSGEHGIGVAKREYLNADLGDTIISLQRRIKKAFDPRNILNPGKVI